LTCGDDNIIYEFSIKDKKMIIIGIPGSFTPVCQNRHIPSYVELEDELKKKGVSEVFVMSAQDSAVMEGFSEKLGIKDDSIIKFVGDPSLAVSKKFGVLWDIPVILDIFGGARCKRFAMLVDGGKVKHIAVADGEGVKDEDTFADKVIEHA